MLQERLNDRLEKQQQEKALQLYLSQVDDLDQWLLSTRSMLDSTPQDLDMNEQLSDCQVRALSTFHIHCMLRYKNVTCLEIFRNTCTAVIALQSYCCGLR